MSNQFYRVYKCYERLSKCCSLGYSCHSEYMQVIEDENAT